MRRESEKKASTVIRPLNWKRVRVSLLKKSVPIPAPIFFLIFSIISWACLTLYFRLERANRQIVELQQRTQTVESQLEEFSTPSEDLPPEDEGIEVPTTQILEM